MYVRMTFLTVLIALFGISMSFVANNATRPTGTAWAFSEGTGCSFEQGVVCPIQPSGNF